MAQHRSPEVVSKAFKRAKAATKTKASKLMNIVKGAFTPSDRRGTSNRANNRDFDDLDLDAIGAVRNVKNIVRVEVDPQSKTGFKGLPPDMGEMLIGAGITDQEIQQDPEAAMQVAETHLGVGGGGLDQFYTRDDDKSTRLKNAQTMRYLMQQVVKINKTDPLHRYASDFKTDRLGGGSFGEVYKCKDIDSGKVFAMKVSKDDKLKLIDREIRMHALANGHDNIVGFQEAFHYKHKVYMIVEFMNAGSLYDFIYELPMKLRWREKAIAYFIKGILAGLSSMHKQHHLHRDIKSQNILLNTNGDVKIADFGFAVGLTKQADKRKTVLGSPFWMAPELIGKQAYDAKVDVWSTAITAFEAAESQPPHMGEQALRVMFLIKIKPSPTLTDKSHWTERFTHFMRVALAKNPADRPTSTELLDHPFLEKSVIAKRRHFIRMLDQISDMKRQARERRRQQQQQAQQQ